MRVLGDPLARTLGGLSLGQVAGVNTYLQQLRSIAPANLIALWTMSDLSGTTAVDSVGGFNGTYTGTVTLAQPGIGDGSVAASFGGGRVSLSSILAALETPFDAESGTLLIACQVASAAFWTDGAFHVAAGLGVDTNNRILLYKSNTNNTFIWLYYASGGTTIVNRTLSTLNPFVASVTWNKAANQFRGYINRTQSGATQTNAGTWTGSLAAAWSAIGSQSSAAASSVWSGLLADCALWNIPLTPEQIASAAPASLFPD